MFQSHYCEVAPGVSLRYFDEGAGQPILFVPGWAFSAEVFEHQIRELRSDYRCIAVDPRCQGGSAVTLDDCSYEQQGADLDTLIRALDLKDIILVGWSFGALACWAYARQFGTGRIAASVTFDNSPRSISDDEAEYRAGTLADLRGAHFESLRTPAAFRTFMEGFADGLLYEGKMEPALRQKLIDSACEVPLMAADMLYLDGWLTDEVETVKMLDRELPCLLFIANYRKDAGVPFMEKNYPNTEIHAFGMHMMFHEYPERCNRILREFIQSKVRKK